MTFNIFLYIYIYIYNIVMDDKGRQTLGYESLIDQIKIGAD
jgi:hypothetical protein